MMPGPESNFRMQDAIYWANSGTNDSYGQPKVASTIPVKVRWNQGVHESGSSTGTPKSYDGELIVDRSMPIGGILWLGAVADYVATDTKFQIADYNETLDIKGRAKHRTVKVTRYSDTLPLLV